LLHQEPAIPQKKISTVCGGTGTEALAACALMVSPVAGKTLGPVAVGDWLMTVISMPTLAGGSFTLSPAVATVAMKQFIAVSCVRKRLATAGAGHDAGLRLVDGVRAVVSDRFHNQAVDFLSPLRDRVYACGPD
jgi:hypothetical protein